ncbi:MULTISPECIES: PQQ-binding-like beta-propeller repeat protein [unclassified Janthinobacterium]|uniref:outer membrane protein assembly factor BamB family protein n=1 Tax=unclassified Janthinobacterium TaxID=2610881 RepID=UPI000889CE0E|nr:MULTISPECIES: PQQ-binding-like beta-propeller repeat protein [unclassified Janthinobacterium]SDA67800.1 Outer membrane protein assembly factor BamB, contains PQQ-like beta-propeller repeat [Janthinobacterium sp. 551a]SFB50629.1 Outer membrane protein assembly factor BamB, contains PQQ-like beta-propeller repeat [Janthinobacterium sp. 344]
MTTFLKARLRAAAYPMTVLGVLSLAGCGGGGGESPEQAMDLSQVSLNCVQQPGETCNKVQATVMLYAKVTDQRPLWEEKPAGGAKVFDTVNRIKQADGSWLMDFSVKPGLAEGTYTGTVDFAVSVSPFPGTPNYQPRTASYSITVAGMKGTLSPLRPLSGAADWEGYNGNAAHTAYVPVTLDASKFTRRWSWKGAVNASGASTSISPLVAANGLVYFNEELAIDDTAERFKYLYTYRLSALSETDGAATWQTELKLDYVPGAPGVSGNRLVMAGVNDASTFDALSGARLAAARQPNTNGVLVASSPMTAPTLFGGNAYLGGNNDVISLDATTGQNRWSTSLDLPKLNNVDEWTPAVSASTVYSNAAGTLTAFNIADGSKRFSVAVPGQVVGGTGKSSLRQAPVLVDDNTVLLLNQRPYPGKAVDNSLSLVDAGSRSVRWTVNGRFTTQPVVARGVIYVGNDSGKVIEARNVSDGAVLWTWPLASVGEEVLNGDLIVTNNLLFVAGGRNTHALDLASRQAAWTYRLSGTLSLSRNGVLYIRSAQGVYGSNIGYVTAINVQ